MEQALRPQEDEERFTDGTQEYAAFYGGPATRSSPHFRSASANLPNTPSLWTAPVEPRVYSTTPDSQQMMRIRKSPQRLPIGVYTPQDKALSSDLSSGYSTASTHVPDANKAHGVSGVDARFTVSPQASELDRSRLQIRMSHPSSLGSRDVIADIRKMRFSSEARGSQGRNARVALSSQAPEVEPSLLPEYVGRQLSRSCSASAGLHPVTIDTSLEDARSEVLRQLDPTMGDEILRRLKSSATDIALGSNTTKPDLRRSVVTSLRQAFVRTRPIHPDPLTDVLKIVARDGNLPLVKATIALLGEPIFQSPAHTCFQIALRLAITHGRADVVDYLLWRGVELTTDWHADVSLQEQRCAGPHLSVNYALLEAIQARQVDLAIHLLTTRKANAFLPGLRDPTESGYCASTPFVAAMKITSEKASMRLLQSILNPDYFLHACTTGVFDGSPLVSTQMPQMICEGLLHCIKEARADSAILLMNNRVTKPYVAALMRNETDLLRFNFEIRAFGFCTWDRTTNSSTRRIRIFKLLVDVSSRLKARNHTYLRDIFLDALGRIIGKAINANSADGVNLITKIHPELLRKTLIEDSSPMSPLALAILNEAPRTAVVLLKSGVHPYDWANDEGTALQFATSKAASGSRAAKIILMKMLKIALELAPETLRDAVATGNVQFVKSLLSIMSESAPDAPPEPLYDLLLTLKAQKNQEESRSDHLSIIDILYTWDSAQMIPHVQAKAIKQGIENNNFAGLEMLLGLKVVNLATLPEILQWCISTGQHLMWQYLLNFYGTQ